MVGGIATLAAAIGEDPRGRLPARNKKQRDGLAPLAATMLDVRSANPMALAAAPPRAAERTDMRDQWISRLPGTGLIDVDAVMAPYGREILARLAAAGRRVVPMIDQTQATGRHRVVMAAAHGSAGVPCRWRGGSRRPGEPPAAPSSARLRRRWRACRPKGCGRCRRATGSAARRTRWLGAARAAGAGGRASSGTARCSRPAAGPPWPRASGAAGIC